MLPDEHMAQARLLVAEEMKAFSAAGKGVGV
jgi:hypothetical protein